jgi:hypothetical protein
MRIIPMPSDMIPREITFTRGPSSKGVTESVTGFVQNVESPGGLIGLQLNFPPMRGRQARNFSRLRAALHGGANVLAVPFFDPDEPTLPELGYGITSDVERAGLTWSNGMAWSNGMRWRYGRPRASVAVAAAKGDVVVQLDTSAWGNNVLAAFFGFFGHFGLYAVKEVATNGARANVRIWPPLRAAVTVGQAVTLRPVVAMKLATPDAATATRPLNALDDISLNLVEVTDDVVRRYAEGTLEKPATSGNSNWILATGFWNDNGVWDDNAVWVD